MVQEWNDGNPDIIVEDIVKANIIWLLSDWCWHQVPHTYLMRKKVVTTIHHIVPKKFDLSDFMNRDCYTNAYHVFNDRTRHLIKNHTKKPIHLISYWGNQNVWHPCTVKEEACDVLRDIKHQGMPLPTEPSFIVGSFQRDTEGHDLATPKMEKGPDLFANAVIKMRSTTHPRLHVLLGGWRRQYLIKRLEEAQIPYTYIERPPLYTVGIMYQALDLYMCTARFEGGPQALIECGLMNIPVVSTPVGIAEQVLPESAINADVTKATPAIPDVKHMWIPKAFDPYRAMFESLHSMET